MKRALLALVLLLAVLAIPALADPYKLDFNVPSNPLVQFGTIKYEGGTNGLAAANITIDKLTVMFDPGHTGDELACVDCVLSFTSGPLDNFTSVGLYNWAFSGGGTLTLTGKIPGAGITTSTTLMHDDFLFANVIGGLVPPHPTFPLTDTFKVTIAQFLDKKNDTLLDYLGLGFYKDQWWLGSMNISFTATQYGDGTFDSTQIGSGNVTNEIPEPGTLLLVGAALLGLTGILKRRVTAR